MVTFPTQVSINTLDLVLHKNRLLKAYYRKKVNLDNDTFLVIQQKAIFAQMFKQFTTFNNLHNN